MEKDIWTRTQCPCCGSSQLSDPVQPHENLPFPILPVCVDTPREDDITAPFTIVLCQDCGLILLKRVINPEVLYTIFHSDGIGKTWDAHYEAFAALIRKHHKGGRVLEIGAGQGKLIGKLLPHYESGVEVIDPMYEGPRENVVVHEGLLSPAYAARLAGQFDAVVSSHTLEHFIDFNEYFASAVPCLKEGGLVFTSVPNQETNFARGYGNMLNFEHPSICTNAHWLYLHVKHGLVIKEISFFRDHSVQIVAQKTETAPMELNARELSAQLVKDYGSAIERRIATIRSKAGKKNWLFGASNYSQPLFMYGLEESVFEGVMDNSPLKHGKRLYGTTLTCRKPEDIVGKEKGIRVFLNVGAYNQEVEEQLRALDPDVECIVL